MTDCKEMLIGGGKTETPRVRDERIDSVKYCLMVLVIAGHVLTKDGFKNLESCTILWKWIYVFHMPLFVFLSGYFSHKKDIKKFKTGCWKLLEPLFIYHFLLCLLVYLKGGSITLTYILTPWWVLWYLLSLLYWRALLQIIPDNIINNTKLVLIVTFAISILAGFLPFDKVLSIQRTLSFLPFFFMGYCMRGKNLFIETKYRPLCFAFLMMTLIMSYFYAKYLSGLSQSVQYDNIDDAFVRVIVFCLSIPMSIAFINICPNTSWIAKQGKLTMQYYIYHACIIYFLMSVAGGFIPKSFISATIITISIILGLGIMTYLPYFDKFTNPSSFFKK